MNCYATVTDIKSSSYLNISVTDYDTYFRRLLDSASREFDRLCDRFFYCWEGIRYFDGTGLKLFTDDLLSIATLKTDEDGDGVYENTFATSDYIKYPLNGYPKTKLEIASGGDYGSFASGVGNGVQITGVFGYGDEVSATPYVDSGTLTAEELDTTETGVDVVSGTPFSAGHTIRIESEQMYVESVSANTLTVRRGVNGTTAATHATSKAVYVYEYPMPIAQACLITAMRAFKRKDTAYADIISSPELGQIIMSKGLDPDVKIIIERYRKWSY